MHPRPQCASRLVAPLRVCHAQGLTNEQYQIALAEFGANALTPKASVNKWHEAQATDEKRKARTDGMGCPLLRALVFARTRFSRCPPSWFLLSPCLFVCRILLIKTMFSGLFNLLLWAGSVLCFIAYAIDPLKDATNLYLGIVLAVVVRTTHNAHQKTRWTQKRTELVACSSPLGPFKPCRVSRPAAFSVLLLSRCALVLLLLCVSGRVDLRVSVVSGVIQRGDHGRIQKVNQHTHTTPAQQRRQRGTAGVRQ